MNQHDLSSLHKCVSAGEALPAATRKLWKEATGIEIIDGIGSTELFHIFISADEAQAKPGATGLPVPGYIAAILTTKAVRCLRVRWGDWRSKGPQGANIWMTPGSRSTCKTAGTSPATPTWWMKMGTMCIRRALTT